MKLYKLLFKENIEGFIRPEDMGDDELFSYLKYIQKQGQEAEASLKRSREVSSEAAAQDFKEAVETNPDIMERIELKNIKKDVKKYILNGFEISSFSSLLNVLKLIEFGLKMLKEYSFEDSIEQLFTDIDYESKGNIKESYKKLIEKLIANTTFENDKEILNKLN